MKRHALLATLLGALTSLPLHVLYGETTDTASATKQNSTSLDTISDHVETDTPAVKTDEVSTDVTLALPTDYSSESFQMQDFMAGTSAGSIGDSSTPITDSAGTEDSMPFPQEEPLADSTDITAEESSTALQEQDTIASLDDGADKQK